MIFLVFLTSMLYVYYTHASSYVVSEGNSGTACDVASNVFNSELGYNNNAMMMLLVIMIMIMMKV